MKKIILGVALVLAGLSVNAQGKTSLGVNFGTPTGDLSDLYTFAFSFEANYIFPVSEKFDVGFSTMYLNFYAEDILGIPVDNISFLPIAAVAHFNITEKLVLGADVGYAIGISPDGNDGGFYYRPMVGFRLGERLMIQATYSGVSVNDVSIDHLAAGLMFQL